MLALLITLMDVPPPLGSYLKENFRVIWGRKRFSQIHIDKKTSGAYTIGDRAHHA